MFVHINKTGGSTFRRILRSSFGTRHCDVEPWRAASPRPPFLAADLRKIRKLYPSLESIAGHRLTGLVPLEESGPRFEYVTVMRDPVKACASRFQYNVDYRKKKGLIFEEWLQNDWVRNYQAQRIAGIANLEAAKEVIGARQMFVGLTERFDESIVMFKKLKAPQLDISYQRVNVARDNTLTRSILASDQCRHMIEDANRVDLALYEYVRRELYPAYKDSYGPDLEADVSAFQSSSGGFNDRNIALSRLKQYSLLRPLQLLYRQPLTHRTVARWLDRGERRNELQSGPPGTQI